MKMDGHNGDNKIQVDKKNWTTKQKILKFWKQLKR